MAGGRGAVRYVAFLRGVSPMNAKMPELVRAFERAGLEDVRTVLTSGNVVFTAERAPESELAARAEAAMREHMDRSFEVIVRSRAALVRMLASDPYAPFPVPTDAKRVVTFLRARPRSVPALPIARDGASIVLMRGREAFSVYVPGPRAPAFMAVIERTFGKGITTRTWDTIRKVVR